jgi:hypothetical protein
LDEGIGNTFVSVGATMAVTLPFPSTLRTAREFPRATHRHPAFRAAFQTTNVPNESGNLLFAPQKLPRLKLQELRQLEILAWQLSTLGV